jgi:hypothetical protein
MKLEKEKEQKIESFRGRRALFQKKKEAGGRMRLASEGVQQLGEYLVSQHFFSLCLFCQRLAPSNE